MDSFVDAVWMHELHPPKRYITAASRLRLLGQPREEGVQCVCCYGCCASQERTSLSEVPMAPWVFFQLPCSHLVYHGCAQCTWWDTVRQRASSAGHTAGRGAWGSTRWRKLWPPDSMCYHVAAILSVWAPVEDWEVVDRRALKRCYGWWGPVCRTRWHGLPLAWWGGFSWVPWRQTWMVLSVMLCQCTACRDAWKNRGTYTDLRARTPQPWRTQHLWQWGGKWWWGRTLWDCGSLLGSEACCAAESEAWAACDPGGHPQGPPVWLNSLKQGWLTGVSSFGKIKGKPWQLGSCDSGAQVWVWHIWEFGGSLLGEVEGRNARHHFVKAVLWCRQYIVKAVSSDFEKCKHVCGLCMLQKIPSLKWTQHLWDFCGSLIKALGEGNGTPLQCSCLENPMDGGAW